MAVFYRTYRPQRFAEVVGQKPIVTTLLNAVRQNKVAHAYLFFGSRGVGKTTLARLLAKAVNCPNVKDGEPCGKCQVCDAIKNNSFIDLVEIDAASHTGVDNVRELIDHIKFKPTQGRFKVFIIDEVHMLSKAAFNALLKTLEEPPEHVIFILATTDVHKVPATIISRAQRFDFSRIAVAEIVEHLQSVAKKEKFSVEDGVFQLIARQSEGGLRDALSLLGKIASGEGKITLAEVELMLGSTGLAHSKQLTDLLIAQDPAPLPQYVDDLEQSGIDFTIFNRNFLEYLRAVLILKITASAPEGYIAEEVTVMKGQAEQITIQQLMHWLRLFLRSYKELATMPDPSLALLLAALEAVVKPESSSKPAVVNSVRATLAPQPTVAAQPSVSVENQIPAEKMVQEEVVANEPEEDIEQSEPTGDPYTLEEVQAFWPRLVDYLKTVNSPLGTLVKNTPISRIDGFDICITVKYLFHKEHLESKKIHGLLLTGIKEIGGKSARVRIEIGKEEAGANEPSTADTITEVLRVFGGELVE